MTDMRIGVPAAPRENGLLGFLRETVASLGNRRLLLPVLILVVLLTASNIVILLNRPVPGEPPVIFAIAALARVLGLFACAVAILRVLGRSRRAPFMPDGAFWLYGVTIVAGLGLSVVLTRLVGEPTDRAANLIVSALMIVLSAPFAAWFAAIAIERPLAVAPGPWMRGMSHWLPALLLWSFLIVLPLGQLHSVADLLLLRGAGTWFWPVALADGPLSALLAVFGFALAATAYRRVAQA